MKKINNKIIKLEKLSKDSSINLFNSRINAIALLSKETNLSIDNKHCPLCGKKREYFQDTEENKSDKYGWCKNPKCGLYNHMFSFKSGTNRNNAGDHLNIALNELLTDIDNSSMDLNNLKLLVKEIINLI